MDGEDDGKMAEDIGRFLVVHTEEKQDSQPKMVKESKKIPDRPMRTHLIKPTAPQTKSRQGRALPKGCRDNLPRSDTRLYVST